MDQQRICALEDACVRMRTNLVTMTHRMGNVGAHIGGGLSLVEIMAVLYLDEMNLSKELLDSDERDRLILSKGHGVMAMYAAMAEAGIIEVDELAHFKENGARLSAHPSMNSEIGVEFSSGSLGQGLSLGVGTCLALRRKGNETSRVFVVVGDGECDEGQIWEATMTAAHYELDNLVCIVDRNHLQYDGDTEDVKKLARIPQMFEAFGWNVTCCDGHDVTALSDAFKANPGGAPYAIVADTVKGKGVSFMEGNPAYHNNRITDAQLAQALEEIGATR